jgi:hypothetical protein
MSFSRLMALANAKALRRHAGRERLHPQIAVEAQE